MPNAWEKLLLRDTADFAKPKKMKVHVITLGYAPARILSAGIERFYETLSKEVPLNHVVVDHLYPLRHSEIMTAIESGRQRFGYQVLTPSVNMGLHGGLNWACDHIKPAPEDIVVIYDPDSYPLDSGWLQAFVVAIKNGGLSIAGIVNKGILNELKTRTARSYLVDGYLEIIEPKVAGMLSVCGWRWDFVQAAGGFQEPNAHYGGLEAAMWARLGGRKWGYLPQYREDSEIIHCQQDDDYMHWKWRHSQRMDWQGTFESYIAAGCPWEES